MTWPAEIVCLLARKEMKSVNPAAPEEAEAGLGVLQSHLHPVPEFDPTQVFAVGGEFEPDEPRPAGVRPLGEKDVALDDPEPPGLVEEETAAAETDGGLSGVAGSEDKIESPFENDFVEPDRVGDFFRRPVEAGRDDPHPGRGADGFRGLVVVEFGRDGGQALELDGRVAPDPDLRPALIVDGRVASHPDLAPARLAVVDDQDVALEMGQAVRPLVLLIGRGLDLALVAPEFDELDLVPDFDLVRADRGGGIVEQGRLVPEPADDEGHDDDDETGQGEERSRPGDLRPSPPSPGHGQALRRRPDRPRYGCSWPK